MHIFIDESGNFALNQNGDDGAGIDCVAAVIMDSLALKKWNEKYAFLKKASTLSHAKASEIISFLADIGAKTCLIATDGTTYSSEAVNDHRESYIQSAYFVTANHPLDLQESVDYHVKRLADLSTQDYIKSMLLNLLIENAIRGILDQASEYPVDELKTFFWRCDMVSPASHSFIKHFVGLQFNSNSTKKPVRLADRSRVSHFLSHTKSNTYLNAAKILDDFEFQSDDICPGLKAADCIANFLRKICRGCPKIKRVNELQAVFSLPYSIDFVHFNKDEKVLGSDIQDHTKKFFEALNFGRMI